MPQFIGRLVEWFRARSTVQKALIVIGVLVVLLVLGLLIWGLVALAFADLGLALIAGAWVVLLINLVALALRWRRGSPLQRPEIFALACALAAVLFGSIAVMYGGDTAQDTAEVQEVTEEPVADSEPEQEREAEPVGEPEDEPIEIPESVDYGVVGQTGDDDRGFSVRTWAVESEDESLGALCAIAQDAALDAGEGWDGVRVTSEAGDAYVRMTDAAPDYSETEGLLECPISGEIFVTNSPTLRPG